MAGLLSLILAAVLFNCLWLRDACQDMSLYSSIRSNDTIKGGQFSSCQTEILMKLLEDDERPSVSIAAYGSYCDSLRVYHDPIDNGEEHLVDLENEFLPLYDSSVNSSYFAHGISALITAKAITESATNNTARIVVCWFTGREDYEKFLNEDKFKGNCDNLLDVLERDNGTKSGSMSIINDLPSYYFIGFKVVRALSSLWYNFTTVRSYYNGSDLGKDPDCNIALHKHECEFNLPDKKCVMLYAQPQLAENSSIFHPVELKGRKESHEVKHISYIVTWVAVAVISFVAVSICVLLFLKLPRF